VATTWTGLGNFDQTVKLPTQLLTR